MLFTGITFVVQGRKIFTAVYLGKINNWKGCQIGGSVFVFNVPLSYEDLMLFWGCKIRPQFTAFCRSSMKDNRGKRLESLNDSKSYVT